MHSQVLRAVAAAALWFAVFSVPASALEVPDRPQGYVTDRASMLSPGLRQQLEQALRSYEAQTSNQVVVATFPSLEDESLEDFSIRLAERWKVGQKDKDNGVILLLFQAEQLVRIEVGYGLEGALPDALAGVIIRQEIAPHFRQGDYDRGLREGVRAILQAVEGEYTADPLARQGAHARQQLTPEQMAAMQRQSRTLLIFALLAVLGLFIADLVRYRRYRNDHSVYRDRYSFWEWFFRFALLLAVLSIIFRMLFYAMLFSRGGGGGRGGGFSGGGGSFGGGGASGGW